MDIDPTAIKAALDTAKAGFSTLDAALTTIKKLRELVRPKTNEGQKSEPEDPQSIAIRSLIVDLQEQIIAAREDGLAFRQAALEATEALQRANDFEARRGQFRRAELNPGSYVYVPIGDAPEGVPALACATCMEQDRKIVTLQMDKRMAGKDVLLCPKCMGKVTRPNNVVLSRPVRRNYPFS